MKNTTATIQMKISEIRRLGVRCFVQVGLTNVQARIIINALCETSLRAVDSHGIRLIPHYLKAIQIGRVDPSARYTFKQTFSSTGTLHAHNGLGILAGLQGMDHAIRMAKLTGVGSVAISHSSHFGAAGLYTIRAANAGMIGLACTHVEALALPFNGVKPFLGTNAFSVAVPCDGEDPIVLDMATTNMSFNQLRMVRAAGMPIPLGFAADIHGHPTNDPHHASYLTHFGGYKGYGLAFMVEMFSSMLTGMRFGPHITPMYPLTSDKRNLGHFMLAINIAAFEKRSVFLTRMKQMADELRAIPPISKDPVMVPGDPEKIEYKKRVRLGTIPIPKEDYDELREIAQTLSVLYETKNA